jgi:hypothetical protein
MMKGIGELGTIFRVLQVVRGRVHRFERNPIILFGVERRYLSIQVRCRKVFTASRSVSTSIFAMH